MGELLLNRRFPGLTIHLRSEQLALQIGLGTLPSGLLEFAPRLLDAGQTAVIIQAATGVFEPSPEFGQILFRQTDLVPLDREFALEERNTRTVLLGELAGHPDRLGVIDPSRELASAVDISEMTPFLGKFPLRLLQAIAHVSQTDLEIDHALTDLAGPLTRVGTGREINQQLFQPLAPAFKHDERSTVKRKRVWTKTAEC
jgi:hypothetical protein